MYQCQYCPKTYAQHNTRMSEHLNNCKGYPESIKQNVEQKMKPKDELESNNSSIKQKQKRQREASDDETSLNASNSTEKSQSENVEGIEVQKNSKVVPAPKIKLFMDHISKKDQTQAKELLAKTI